MEVTPEVVEPKVDKDAEALEAYAQEKYGTSWADQQAAEASQRARDVREKAVNSWWNSKTIEEKEALAAA